MFLKFISFIFFTKKVIRSGALLITYTDYTQYMLYIYQNYLQLKLVIIL
jgi:hypothetical protein